MAAKINDDASLLHRNNSIEQRSASELRKVANQNLRERIHCDTRTTAIDRERKTLRAQLDREETELRTQLERLEIEKLALDDIDSLQGDSVDSGTDIEDYGDPTFDLELTNPYPVTIGKQKQSSRQQASSQHRARKSSSNSESPDPLSSRSLPPLQSHSRQSLVTSCRSDVSMSSRSSVATVTSRSCVGMMTTPRGGAAAAENYDDGDDNGGLWVGDPEAIQSVRRPRRSIAQQHHQRSEAANHAWKRSRSLKEKSRDCSSSASSMKSSVLGRSQSLRDAKCGGRTNLRTPMLSPCSLSRTTSRGSNVSRSPSYQEDQTLQQSIECLVDAATEAELNRGPAHRCLRRHLVGRSNSSLGTSPDTKSTVWGWIRDVEPGIDPENAEASASSLTTSKTGIRNCDPPPPPQQQHQQRPEMKSKSENKLQRRSSAKMARRKPRDLASISAADCVGVIGNEPLIPSPSHLSVEKCYELLASAPIGAPKSPTGVSVVLPTKLAPIPSAGKTSNI